MKTIYFFSLVMVPVLVVMCVGIEEEPDHPVAQTASGRIRGKIIPLSDGQKVVAFLGVRYAEPPVGDRRFKAPVAASGWTGVLDATAFGPLCPQSRNRSHWDVVVGAGGKRVLRRLGLWDYPQEEDCLNLNLYVPQQHFPSEDGEPDDEAGLPVMVFFHGGSYKTNGGRFYPGEWLAAKGRVVVVTLNYRLGVLGFLSTEDDAARGNYGLLDQLLALEWVKENAVAFGGDPQLVTIFGNSAGGACVGLHLLSPMARGLFRRAVAQSGSPIGEWAVQRRPRMYVERLARKLHCPDTSSSRTILDCLRSQDVQTIVDKSEDAKSLEDSLMLQFAPSVDGRFLPDHPAALLQREGALGPEPPPEVVVGVTRDELEVWMTKYHPFCNLTRVPHHLENTILPVELNAAPSLRPALDKGNERIRAMGKMDCLVLAYQDKDPSTIKFTRELLRKYLLHLVRRELASGAAADVLLHAVYTEYVYRHAPQRRRQQNGTEPRRDDALPDIRTLGKIISDIDLKAPSVRLVELLSLHPGTSVYLYEFDYASSDDVIAAKYVGSYHESELYYLFGFPHFGLENALRLPQDKQVSDTMIRLWTDFARTGDPTPAEANRTSGFRWRPYTQDDDCFASLGLEPFVAHSYESERMTFWNHFVPLFTEYPVSLSSNRSTGHHHLFAGLSCDRTVVLSLLALLVVCSLLLCFSGAAIVCCCRKKRAVLEDMPVPV